MKLIVRLAIIVSLFVFTSPELFAQDNPAAARLETKQVDVGGHKLTLQTAGKAAAGVPTVVLDYGLGGALGTWNQIFPALSRFTRVVAYDRAGYAKSEPGPEPRSFENIARELHTLLHRANIAPPYVLVGHSLGGANVRAFAHLYQNEVAGLILIDPINVTFFTAASAEQQARAKAQQEAALQNEPAGAKAEWAFLKGEMQQGFPQLRAFGAPPDVPMALLIAGRDRPPHWVKSSLSEYGPWIADASEASLMVIPESGHTIQFDEPRTVISAIRRVVFPDVQNRLARTIKEKGAGAAMVQYRGLKEIYPAEFFRESTLNVLGYQELRAQHVAEAIVLFRLNVEMYPKAFNTYDSLAEAYMMQGDRDLAIANYRKSLELNPQNTNAVEMLKKLEPTSEPPAVAGGPSDGWVNVQGVRPLLPAVLTR
jgi:pimeloyl-ACP methyl ester carboxylesterase